jgi:hypothetical protein
MTTQTQNKAEGVVKPCSLQCPWLVRKKQAGESTSPHTVATWLKAIEDLSPLLLPKKLEEHGKGKKNLGVGTEKEISAE